MRYPNAPSARRRAPLVLALAAVLAAGTALAESGTVLKPTELRSEPLGSADVVGRLTAKESVDITERKGAWAGVKTPAGAAGWVRILNLRTGTSDGKAAGGGNALAAVFQTGSSGGAVTTGVKGLSPDILRGAYPDMSEVEMLETLAASGDDARLFAMTGGLSAQKVDYLKEGRGGRRKQR